MPCHNSGERILSHMDRKAKKPLMEKRRRARINKCLNDLKMLLLEHLKRDPSQTSKLEKADILEMTVHLIRRMQQEQLMRASVTEPMVKDRFLDGWKDCAAQVNHYVTAVDGIPTSLKESLQRYLMERYRALQQTWPIHAAPSSAVPLPAPSAFQQRQRLPVPGFNFPPICFPPTTTARQVTPALYPPALLPSTFVSAAVAVHQWQRPATVFERPVSITNTSEKLQTASGFVSQVLCVHGGNPETRPDSLASTSRALIQTPECYTHDDEDDSVSCSSSDANERHTPDARMTKDHVWRPW